MLVVSDVKEVDVSVPDVGRTAVAGSSNAAEPVAAVSRVKRTRSGSRILSQYGIVIAWVIEIIFFSIVESRSFFSAGNFKELASSQAALVILALAVVPTLAVGEVDLSVASVMAFSAILFGQLNGVDHWSVLASLAVALLGAVLTGFANAVITVLLKVRGIIVTLGMGTLVLGLTVEFSHSLSVGGVSQRFQNVINHPIGGISASFYFALCLTIGLWYLFRHTPAGRWMLFVGFNGEVARLSGINVARLRMAGFVVGSFFAGLAGIMAIGIAGGADPSSFQPLLLPAFAATFLGTLIFTPGRVNAIGSMVALYFLATGVIGIQLLGVGSWIDDAFYGGALVVTVALSGLSEVVGFKIRKGVKQ